MECLNEECTLKREINAIKDSVNEFQNRIAETIETFKDEIQQSIIAMDQRQNSERKDVEHELRAEMQRHAMTMSVRIDNTIESTNQNLMSINSDMGEIKGALGLKATKDETGQLRTSVMNRMEAMKKEARNEAQAEYDRFKERQSLFRTKVLFTIIGLLSSGLFLAIGLLVK